MASMTSLKEEPTPEINEEDPFKEVIEAIDQMLTDLKAEEEADIANKERCEKERMENTQAAKMTSKQIDTNTETIDRLTAEIAAANKTVEVINEEIADLNSELQDAADTR